jgi:hypothetical protein
LHLYLLRQELTSLLPVADSFEYIENVYIFPVYDESVVIYTPLFIIAGVSIYCDSLLSFFFYCYKTARLRLELSVRYPEPFPPTTRIHFVFYKI